MRTIDVAVTIYEKGDRVITPEGEGTVYISENIPKYEWDLYSRDIKVELDKTPASGGGKIKYFDIEHVFPLN